MGILGTSWLSVFTNTVQLISVLERTLVTLCSPLFLTSSLLSLNQLSPLFPLIHKHTKLLSRDVLPSPLNSESRKKPSRLVFSCHSHISHKAGNSHFLCILHSFFFSNANWVFYWCYYSALTCWEPQNDAIKCYFSWRNISKSVSIGLKRDFVKGEVKGRKKETQREISGSSTITGEEET